MNIVKRIIPIILLLTFLFTFSCFAENRICSVDLVRVFDEYKKRGDFDKELESKGKEEEAHRDKLIEDLKEIRDKMVVVSDKEKEKKQKELTVKSKELQEFDQKLRIDLRKDWDEKLREVLEDIKKSVEEFAKKEKCDFVIDSKVLLYGGKNSDVTKGIVKILNKKYKKR